MKYKASVKAPKHIGNFQLLGYKVNSPFGSSSSPTGLDSNYIKVMFENGYDIVTTKTRRSIHFSPNPVPNILHVVPGRIQSHDTFAELPDRTAATFNDYQKLTIINSFGNNSLDPEYWIPDAIAATSRVMDGQLLITSIVGTIQPGFTQNDYFRDFAKTAVIAKDTQAQAIEINLSCPNVATEGVVCYDKKAVLQICKLVKEAVNEVPIIAKFGYFSHHQHLQLDEIVQAIAPYVAAISAVNTSASPVLDDSGNQLLPGEGRLKAGLSGYAIKDLGIDMVSRLNGIRKKRNLNYEIIGIGGVLTPQDFIHYREVGADAVLSATGAMWNANLANLIKSTI